MPPLPAKKDEAALLLVNLTQPEKSDEQAQARHALAVRREERAVTDLGALIFCASAAETARRRKPRELPLKSSEKAALEAEHGCLKADRLRRKKKARACAPRGPRSTRRATAAARRRPTSRGT